MLQTLLVNLKLHFREKAQLFWLFAFPIILATMFNGMFGNIAESYALHTVDVVVVNNDDWRASPGAQMLVDGISSDTGATGADGDHAKVDDDGDAMPKLITVTVSHAQSATAARLIAKKVVGSSLVKTAMFGKDPNWGRIIAAIGAAETAISPDTIAIIINDYPVMQAGAPVAFNQTALANSLEDPHITIQIDLNNGAATGQAWGSDLTYDYVKINALYTT